MIRIAPMPRSRFTPTTPSGRAIHLAVSSSTPSSRRGPVAPTGWQQRRRHARATTAATRPTVQGSAPAGERPWAVRPIRLRAAQCCDALEQLLERFLQLLGARRIRVLQLAPELTLAQAPEELLPRRVVDPFGLGARV